MNNLRNISPGNDLYLVHKMYIQYYIFGDVLGENVRYTIPGARRFLVLHLLNIPYTPYEE
jgi:hypothetical protein